MPVSPSDSKKADLATERILLEVPKGYWNHYGGHLLFGPDGYLYLSVGTLSYGDGGRAPDRRMVSQDLTQLPGKILRIDVNSRTDGLSYGIPKDNPFAAPK